jgi:hypothetical protein
MKVPRRSAPETRSWGAFFDHDADGTDDLLVAERGLVVSLHHGTPTGPRRRLLHAGNTQPDGRWVFNVVGDMSGGGLSEVLIASSYNEPWTPPFVGHFVTAHDPSPGTFGYGRLERSLLSVRFRTRQRRWLQQREM